PITDVSRDRVKQFVAAIRTKTVTRSFCPIEQNDETSGATEQEVKARLLSKETIRNIIAALRACLSEAVESNLIPANPALNSESFKKKLRIFTKKSIHLPPMKFRNCSTPSKRSTGSKTTCCSCCCSIVASVLVKPQDCIGQIST